MPWLVQGIHGKDHGTHNSGGFAHAFGANDVTMATKVR